MFFIYEFKGRRRAIPLASGNIWELTPYVSTLDATRCINQQTEQKPVKGDLIAGVRFDAVTVQLFRGWLSETVDDVWRRDDGGGSVSDGLTNSFSDSNGDGSGRGGQHAEKEPTP